MILCEMFVIVFIIVIVINITQSRYLFSATDGKITQQKQITIHKQHMQDRAIIRMQIPVCEILAQNLTQISETQ